MMISGHSTESNFLKYIKLTKEQNARKLAKHPHFTKLAIASKEQHDEIKEGQSD